MILTDCHVHSSFSSDSSTPMEAMVEKALEAKFESFYITDHMDYDFPISQGLDFLFSPQEYMEYIQRLKKQYDGRISIYTGVEAGLKTTVTPKIKSLLSSFPFDLVIGSVHLVNNVDPYLKDFWENRTGKEALTSYFKAIIENLYAYDDFDVLGHLDYVIRYAPASLQEDFSYEDYQELLDEILTFIIHHQIALEVNTAGYKTSPDQPNPHTQIIKRYLSLGGEMISIGSDAHEPQFYGYGFDKVRLLLLSLGVNSYTTFIQRKPVFHKL